MKFLIFFLFLFPLFLSLSLSTPSQKQVTFLPLRHSHPPTSSSSFKAKNQLSQDTVIVYTPVDEITSFVASYPCDIIYSPYYDLCSSYLSCGGCLSSPYCGWCSSSGRCLPGTVSQVACPSSCLSTWLFTDYSSICTGQIVTQSITESWVASTPTVVASVDTVYHTTTDNMVYVQIGTRESVVMDENMNEVIESVPIYAEYLESVPIGQIETRYYTVSPTIVDNGQNGGNNNNTNSSGNASNSTANNSASAKNSTDDSAASASTDNTTNNTGASTDNTTNNTAAASPADNSTNNNNATASASSSATDNSSAASANSTDNSTSVNNATDNSTSPNATADNNTAAAPSGFLTKADKTTTGKYENNAKNSNSHPPKIPDNREDPIKVTQEPAPGTKKNKEESVDTKNAKLTRKLS